MTKLKDIVKVVIFLIGGFAIVVVGGFMMRSIAKLWDNDNNKKQDPQKENTTSNINKSDFSL
jgi:hypothetical protein